MSAAGQIERLSLQPAFVLHQRPYRDSSVLLEVFNPEHGRFGLIAKGVKGKKQNRQALLQPFTPLLLSWSSRGDLGTLTDCELDGAAMRLNGAVLLSGFYLNELLMHLLHRHDPHPDLFAYYRYTLEQLDSMKDTQAAAPELQMRLRYFEKCLLQEVGYAMELEHDVETGEVVQPDRFYRYVIGEGPIGDAVPGKANVFSGASLLAYAAERLDSSETLRDAKRLSRALIDHYLGGRPLNSRKLMLDLQRNAEAAELNKHNKE